MPTVEDSIAVQLGNIEATYGRSIDEWVGVVSASGLTKHNEVVAMLKASHPPFLAWSHPWLVRMTSIGPAELDQGGGYTAARIIVACDSRVHAGRLESS
jgi:hypothetical protein